MKLLKRITDYYRDKVLAEKCGLEVKDICAHEPDDLHIPMDVLIFKCVKCGEFYR